MKSSVEPETSPRDVLDIDRPLLVIHIGNRPDAGDDDKKAFAQFPT